MIIVVAVIIIAKIYMVLTICQAIIKILYSYSSLFFFFEEDCC